jgi:hypothetical protein
MSVDEDNAINQALRDLVCPGERGNQAMKLFVGMDVSLEMTYIRIVEADGIRV